MAAVSPFENGYCESFNGKLWDESLDGDTFLRRAAAESGRLRHGDGGGWRGDRRLRAFMLAILDGGAPFALREAQFIIATDWFRYYREKVLK